MGALKRKKTYFIVGPHRSGTTFLQTLLGCMPEVATGPETHFFCRIKPYLMEIQEQKSIISTSDIFTAIENIMFKQERKLSDVKAIENGWKEGGWTGLFFSLISSTFFSVSSPTSPVYIEKTPGHLMHISEISREIPKAKFVVMYRDPRSIATSMFKFVPGLNKQKRMGWLRTEMGYIHSCFGAIKELIDTKNERVFLVQYENLMAKQNQLLKKVCQFLNISFREPDEKTYQQVLKSITLNSEIHKAGNRAFRLGNTDSRPKVKLSFAEKLYLELCLYPHMKQFGYRSRFLLFLLPHRVTRYLVYLWNKKVPPWNPFPEKKTLLDKYIPWSPEMF
jgi:hypothetical protein